MIVQVSNSAELKAALNAVHSGDEIRLAAGSYGELVVKNLQVDGTVTITSADPGNKAVFDHVYLANDSGLKLSNIEVQVADGGKGIELGGGSNITLDHLDVHGAPASDGTVGTGVGMYVRNSDGVSVTNSEFSHLVHGLAQLDNTHLKISDNTFHEIRVDGIRGGGSSYVEVSRNYFTNFHRNPGEHSDAIQFWTSNTTEAAHDIVITDNVYVRGDGTYAQGIFLGNELRMNYENVTITGNAVIGGMPNGIAIGYADGVVIEDNLVLGYTDRASKIRSDYTTNVTLSHNTTSHFVLQHNGDGIVQVDNTITSLLPIGDTSALKTWITAHGGADSGLPAQVIELFAGDAAGQGHWPLTNSPDSGPPDLGPIDTTVGLGTFFGGWDMSGVN